MVAPSSLSANFHVSNSFLLWRNITVGSLKCVCWLLSVNTSLGCCSLLKSILKLWLFSGDAIHVQKFISTSNFKTMKTFIWDIIPVKQFLWEKIWMFYGTWLNYFFPQFWQRYLPSPVFCLFVYFSTIMSVFRVIKLLCWCLVWAQYYRNWCSLASFSVQEFREQSKLKMLLSLYHTNLGNALPVHVATE